MPPITYSTATLSLARGRPTFTVLNGSLATVGLLPADVTPEQTVMAGS